jgi:hypothetical protein
MSFRRDGSLSPSDALRRYDKIARRIGNRVTLLYAQSSADLNVPTILTAYPVLIFVVLFLTWAILWHGTTRYVPKADRFLTKRLGFVWMEIM